MNNSFVKFNSVMINTNNWLYMKLRDGSVLVNSFGKASDILHTNMSKEDMRKIMMDFVDDEVKSDHFVFLNNCLINLDKLQEVDSIKSVHYEDTKYNRKFDYIRFIKNGTPMDLELDEPEEQEEFIDSLYEYMSLK